MPSKIRILAGRGALVVYSRLPLPLPVKWRIKSFLYRHLGPLLKSSANYQQWLIQTSAGQPATGPAPDSTHALSLIHISKRQCFGAAIPASRHDGPRRCEERPGAAANGPPTPFLTLPQVQGAAGGFQVAVT